MQEIRLEDDGYINRDDAAYPTLVRLEGGDLLAAFTVGDGPLATGGTYCSRSIDNGRTWESPRVILAAGDSPPTRNSLRLSETGKAQLLAYGMVADRTEGKMEFGQQQRRDPVLCRSSDGGRAWGEAEYLDTVVRGPFEISNPIVVLEDGAWLAPAATMHEPGRFGERVLVFRSTDEGRTWPECSEVMKDGRSRMGFFEQKVIRLGGGRLLATAWAVSLPEYTDLDNHFVISDDCGRSWSEPASTSIRGQTLTPTWLGDNRLLVLYNRRYGRQGIVAALVRMAGSQWHVESEALVWNAGKQRDSDSIHDSGLAELQKIEFGLPSAIPLGGNAFMASFWCRENDHYCVKWAKLRIG